MKKSKYFQFGVSLLGVEPAIFRRFLLRADATFEDLHLAIQDASSWKNYQPYLFWSAHGNMIALKDDWYFKAWRYPLGEDVPLESYFAVNSGLPPVTECVYEYELDTWYCHVVLERCVTLEEQFERRLLTGARAFPLEDCRGMSGYQKCIQVARAAEMSVDPGFMDKNGLMFFLEDWRPDRFDLDAVKETFDRGPSPQSRQRTENNGCCIPGLEDLRPGKRARCRHVSHRTGGRCGNEVVEGSEYCESHGGQSKQLPEWVVARFPTPWTQGRLFTG